MEEIELVKEKLQSKKNDCEAFSKKHKDRGNEDLYQYYEGALWAFKYALKIIDNPNEISDQ